MTRRSILTVLIAVLGLALSAALAWSASQLAGQRIGLASEPLAVTRGLAPRHRAVPAPRPIHDHRKGGAKPASPPRKTATTSRPQIFSTSTAAPAPVTSVAPAPSAPPAATSAAPPAARTTTSSSPAASPSSPSGGASRRRDDHHPDD